jgi:hypothetical protein
LVANCAFSGLDEQSGLEGRFRVYLHLLSGDYLRTDAPLHRFDLKFPFPTDSAGFYAAKSN